MAEMVWDWKSITSLLATIVFIRTAARDFVPPELRHFLNSLFTRLLSSFNPTCTVIVDELDPSGSSNDLFSAIQSYLSSRCLSSAPVIHLSKSKNSKTLTSSLPSNHSATDWFEGVEMKWRYHSVDRGNSNPRGSQSRDEPYGKFELTFHGRFKEMVQSRYVQFIIEEAARLKLKSRERKLHTNQPFGGKYGNDWSSVPFNHPSTFDTLAIDPALRDSIRNDLLRFSSRQDYYSRVGRAWKRGYLLYGPPGTGKTSLIAATGSGKTAAFALPIIAKLAEDPYGIFTLVITPSRELGVQLIEQFRAFGVGLNLRCCLVVGGLGMAAQAKGLLQRPHVVVATPGRIRYLMEDPDIAKAFSKTKFLVLDEADRVLDVGFEGELRVIFKCLPKNRQTLLFSATKTSTLQALHDISPNSTYFYEEYVGLTTVESLKQQYIFIPKNVKDVYLHHILSRMEDNDIRSAIVFVATCKSCYLLRSLLEELDLKVVALNSLNSQSERLSALNRFKSGQVPILLATDLASRGLDIPTVDLIINYDIPRDPPDYVHRVGRTARAGREGLSISFITQNDIDLIHAIEAEIKKQLDAYECNEKEVLEDITKVYKARRVARMKMSDDGYEEKAEARKKLNKRRRESADELDN